MTKNFPPLKLIDALAFSVCESYKNFTICVYAGGNGYSMYWCYIIYDSAGDRYHFNALPSASWQGSKPTENCWDVPDGLEYCRGIVDRWEIIKRLN